MDNAVFRLKWSSASCVPTAHSVDPTAPGPSIEYCTTLGHAPMGPSHMGVPLGSP